MEHIIYETLSQLKSDLPFKFKEEHLDNSEIYIHWHESVEFFCCVSGEVTILCNNRTIEMKPGDTVIINRRYLHKIIAKGKVIYHYLIVHDGFFEYMKLDCREVIFTEALKDDTASEYMKNIFRAFSEPQSETGSSEKILAVLSYVIYMYKNYAEKGNCHSDISSKNHSAVLLAMEYINKNFAKKISLDSLCTETRYSKYHFSRIFKENTGITIPEYINAVRCENARMLLKNSDISVSEISYECGFESPSYFSKTFRKLHGVLPSAFRKKGEKFQ